MKLLHIADLHIGKRVNGMSMIEEQANVIGQLVTIARDENVAGVLIAGDVFDRPVPSREALETCESLFSGFCEAGIEVFAIPGNHDAPQQLSFCSALLASSGLHIAKAFDGHMDSFDLVRGAERVRIHLLPFVRPTDVRMALPDAAASIASHDDAVRAALACDDLDPGACNVLVTHQFVTAAGCQPETCDSEVVSVGGTDNVDVSAFDSYDYVALGHLHGAQHVGRPQVRYSGSPLKYSFSEVLHEKSATIVTIEDGKVEVGTRPLVPLHDMREMRASFAELSSGIDEGDPLDYMRITLTDKSLPDAMAKLRVLYPNILRLDWEQLSMPQPAAPGRIAGMEKSTPLELFASFYEQQTGMELTSDEREAVRSCIEEVSS